MKIPYRALLWAHFGTAFLLARPMLAQDASVDVINGLIGEVNLSSDGMTLAARCRNTTGIGQEPCLWTLNGGLVHIDFPDSLGNQIVTDLSGDATTLVGSIVIPDGRGGGYHLGYIWTAASGISFVGHLGGADPEGFQTVATAVSSDASVVVGSSRGIWEDTRVSPPDEYWETQAFKWSGGTIEAVPFPALLFPYSVANAVSPDGTVIVGEADGTDGNGDYVIQAFRSIGGSIEMLGTPPGWSQTIAYGVSNNGAVIVGSGYTDTEERALLWDGAWKDLGPGRATAVSPDGEFIVGDNRTGDAFLWTNIDGMRNLEDILLIDHGVNSPTSFLDASDVVVVGDTLFVAGNTGNAGYRVKLPLVTCSAKRSSFAQLISWKNAAGGAFGNAANWNTLNNKPPGADSVAVFGIGSATYAVAVNKSVENRRLDVDSDKVTIQVNSGPYTLSGEARLDPSGACGFVESIRVLSRSGRPSALVVESGVMDAGGDVFVGIDGPGEASLTVSGSNAELLLSDTDGGVGRLLVGSDVGATGTVLIDQGGVVTAKYGASLGIFPGSTGSVTVQGAGSRFETTQAEVGDQGTGYLEISDDAVADIGELTLSRDLSSMGTVLVTGANSKLTVETITHVGGVFGEGFFTVEDGAEVSVTLAVPMTIGRGGDGQVLITDAGSLFEARESNVIVGDGGSGRFEVENGASAFLGFLEVGNAGTGTVRVDGAGSRLEVSHPSGPQNILIGRMEDGSVEVTNGGVLASGGDLVVGAEPAVGTSSGLGTLTVKGNASRVIAPGLVIGRNSRGEAHFESTIAAFPQYIKVGESAFNNDPTPSLLEMTSGSQISTDYLAVGLEVGRVRIRTGSQLTAKAAEAGATLGNSIGEIWVEDPGSVLVVTGRLTLGDPGNGVLNVFSGGSADLGELAVMNGSVVGSNIVVRAPTTPKAGQSITAADGTITVSKLLLGPNAVLEVGTVEISPGAVIGGSGAYPLNLTSSGEISPGDSLGHAATFSADSSYTQTSDGSLRIELGGTAEGTYDRLVVAETAQLAGTLFLERIEGYEPSIGDEFEILQAGQVEGVFDTVETDGDYIVDVVYAQTSVKVSVTGFVGVADIAAEVPTEYELSQNYPNPFNPETTIEYALPAPETVQMAVYDMLGRRVAVLVDAKQAAGAYRVRFDGSRLPSGVYTVRLTAGAFQADRNMVLLK